MRPTSSSSDLRGRTASGCLSRILRRILCFSSHLPLRPFNHLKVDERESPEPVGAGGATPGVVARLMGLDSIPPVEESPSSLDSADRFKTSRSPRVRRRPRDIIPAYQELEDDKFFILSFERRRESHVGKVKSSKNSRSRVQQSKEEKNSKREKRRGERESVCLQGENKENENPGTWLLLLNNSCKKSEKSTTKKGIMFENEDSSENSSPNSVLEFVGFSVHQESVSPAEISRLTNSKMRRPLSEELENCGDSKGKLSNDRLDQEDEDLVKPRHKQPNYAGKLGEIGRFAAMETMRTSWLHDEVLKNKHCLLEIGRDIASNIFDHLLEELVSSLTSDRLCNIDFMYL